MQSSCLILWEAEEISIIARERVWGGTTRAVRLNIEVLALPRMEEFWMGS